LVSLIPRFIIHSSEQA